MEEALQSLRSALAVLTDAVTEYPGTELYRRSEPLLVVGISSAAAESSAEYLGKDDEGEVFALTVQAEYSLDIYAPGGRSQGAAQCRQLFGQVAETLKMMARPRITRFTCGKLTFDETVMMYHLPCLLHGEMVLYAQTEEGSEFVDFDLRGVTYNG